MAQGLSTIKSILTSSSIVNVVNGGFQQLPKQSSGMVVRSISYATREAEGLDRKRSMEQGDTKQIKGIYESSPIMCEHSETGSTRNDGMGTIPNSKLSRQVLIDEFSNIYSQYNENNDVDAIIKKEVHSMLPEEIKASLNKAKELYIKSLENTQLQKSGNGENLSKAACRNSASDFLGIKTVYGDMFRPFSTTSSMRKEKKSDCDMAKKLPCLMATELSDKKADLKTGKKGVCEKFCMPCCKPARDPPTCFYPYLKPKCEHRKPPRAAFSECKKIFPLKDVMPCECIRPLAGSCKKSKEAEKCSK